MSSKLSFFSKLWLSSLLFLLLFFLFPQVSSAIGGEYYFRGQVLWVETTRPRDDFKEFVEQIAEVRITSGLLKGEEVQLKNFYVEDQPYASYHLVEDMRIILYTTTDPDYSELGEFYFFGPSRDRGLFFLAGLFIALLFIVGRMQGLKTILSLLISGLIIVKVMLPLLLRGYPPIQVAVLSAGVIIVLVLLILGGFRAKSFSAILGTFIGVVFAGAIALYIGELTFITGFGSDEVQLLVYSPLTMDARGLLFAGIIIGSLGAVTDVAMSVASAAESITLANPKVKTRELFSYSLAVGRDIMGTMANTLILAYVGAAIPLLLVFLSYQQEWLRVLNLDYIATELIRSLAGSIGLIITVPCTAFLSAYFMRGNREDVGEDGSKEEEEEEEERD